jgi:hypothetical protein
MAATTKFIPKPKNAVRTIYILRYAKFQCAA